MLSRQCREAITAQETSPSKKLRKFAPSSHQLFHLVNDESKTNEEIDEKVMAYHANTVYQELALPTIGVGMGFHDADKVRLRYAADSARVTLCTCVTFTRALA